jgi:hypothetical protein
VVLNYFNGIMGTPTAGTNSIRFDLLDLPWLTLPELCEHLIEEEIWAVIHALPPNKALGPNGFTTRFLQVSWPTICSDIMRVFDAL